MANVKISELNPLLTVQDADVLPIVDNGVTKKVTAAILQSYTQGNSVLLTGAQTIAGVKTFTSQLASSVATGTAPFSVASTTKVTNLNADLLDGLSSAAFQGALTLTTTGSSGASTLNTNTLNIPNYTIGGLGGVPYTGATQDVNLGTHDIYANKSWLYDEVNDNYGSTHYTDGNYHIEDADGHKLLVIEDGFMQIHKTDTIQSNLYTSALSETRDHYLPNASGTLALTSDLTAYVPTTRTVSTTSPLTGGGALSSNLTLSIGESSASTNGYLSSGNFTKFNTAYNDSIVSAAVTGTTTKTLTLNQQDGGSVTASWTDDNTDAVTSVFGRTGAVVAASGDYTTTQVTEGTNLYYTDARSRAALSFTAGSGGYNSTTGVITIPTNNNQITNGAGYITSSALSSYLPLAGGTLTGALNGTSASFSGNMDSSGKYAATSNQTSPSDGSAYFYKSSSGAVISGFQFIAETGGAGSRGTRLTIDNAGAATFSSSVTANGDLTVSRSSNSTLISTIKNTDTTNTSSRQILDINAGNVILRLQAIHNDHIYIAPTTAVDTYLGSGYPLILKASGAATFSSSVTTGADATINGVTVGRGGGNVSSNTAIGVNALVYNTTGSNNTANGRDALYSNTTGSNNTANGRDALYSNTTGNYNTAVGLNALFSNTASNNTAVGFEAGRNNTSGSLTAIGYQALRANTTGSNNTANGAYALYSNTTGNGNTANGQNALRSNTTGGSNSAYGGGSLQNNTTGSYNTANGQAALYSNTTGSNNTANGLQSLYSNTTGNYNTANGEGALFFNTTGSSNTANGEGALRSNTTGSYNTAVGTLALYLNTTGSSNTAIGRAALYSNTTGNDNTAIGEGALYSNTTGNYNTGLGYNTQTGNFSGSVILGNSATATGDNQFVVGSSSVNAGAVATESLTSDRSWAVKINGTDYKILLKA